MALLALHVFRAQPELIEAQAHLARGARIASVDQALGHLGEIAFTLVEEAREELAFQIARDVAQERTRPHLEAALATYVRIGDQRLTAAEQLADELGGDRDRVGRACGAPALRRADRVREREDRRVRDRRR
jgi:hypothetical protein